MIKKHNYANSRHSEQWNNDNCISRYDINTYKIRKIENKGRKCRSSSSCFC